MRIAFLVNSIEGETANYTTTHLALSALSYADPISAGTTAVKASHLTELRNGVK